MKYRKAGLVAFIAAVVFMLPLSASASWKIVHQKSSGLVGYHRYLMRNINDKKVHFVKVPKSYVHASGSTHTIKSTKGTKVSFTTKYLLPSPGRNKARWGNPQSIAISKGRLMYVVYCPTNLKNKGQIVRYNLNTLDKLGIRSSPKLLQSVYVKHKGKYSALQKRIQKAIKVGPMFTTGHGQSLAYNFKSGALYMWRDKEKSARVPTSMYGEIQHISPKSLRPDRMVRFKLSSGGMHLPGGHDLAFDKSGNAYFWTNPGAGGYVYKGKISAKHVSFRLTHQIIKHLPGTRIQSMGYNPVRKRLYLVSDGSIASFSASRLKGRGSLTNSNFNWSSLSPKRELEGLAFDKSGHGYLLSNRQPEVLESSHRY
ncbi:hypothetical protein AYR62_14305 [Secundilactobacillus paracollinoides]|uniref:hypothetical protein n=1 Tax=Secundilactobacillus paracollinoides TaxID=240427 RepID=UPI00081A4ABE|nr:hypothetical protein [Secundilactobacillus paracollinoides]ANZ65137.1 hypothetical protein AYR62_14305 [Secundilactobacillus paracollinoides]